MSIDSINDHFDKEAFIYDELWFGKYLEEDIPASVEDQLAWLEGGG